MIHTVALFGESEKGKFKTGYFCQSLEQLAECLGEPPSDDAKGLQYAIQTLLFQQNVVFFRVHEEGFSIEDYLVGFDLLKTGDEVQVISAICLPGVGSGEIIEATTPVCDLYKSFLILTERDLYDYLTNK